MDYFSVDCIDFQKVSLITIGQILGKIQFCAVAKECFTIEQPCRGLMDANIREITLDIRLDPLENPTRDLMNRVQFDKIFFLFKNFHYNYNYQYGYLDSRML